MDDTVGRLQSLFPQEQTDLIVGCLLGDGRLEARSKGKRGYSARLRIHQSDKQEEYVFWKYEVLKDLVNIPPRKLLAWHDPKRDKNHYSWYFHTRSTMELRFWHDYFYPKRKKVVPETIIEFLTPRVLAVWAMDDGTYTNPGFNFNTHSFECGEQYFLQDALLKKFGIKTRLHLDRARLKVALDKVNTYKLVDLIRSYVIPTMQYKIEVPVSTSSMELSER